MHRRDFLRLSGTLAATLFVQFHPAGRIGNIPVEVEAHGRIYRGTRNGKIHVSENAGRTWRLHTNFGSQYSIAGLSVDSGDQVIALLDYLGRGFRLALSKNDGPWRTM